MAALSGPVAERDLLEHPVNNADLKVHIPVQAGAKAVDESDGANVLHRLVHLGRTGAVIPQPLCNKRSDSAQPHLQYRPVTLHKVGQSLLHFREVLVSIGNIDSKALTSFITKSSNGYGPPMTDI